jgi:hypothetical protein
MPMMIEARRAAPKLRNSFLPMVKFVRVMMPFLQIQVQKTIRKCAAA